MIMHREPERKVKEEVMGCFKGLCRHLPAGVEEEHVDLCQSREFRQRPLTNCGRIIHSDVRD
jgi:hypothetical protein